MNIQELIGQFHEIASNPKKQKETYLAAGKKIVLTAPVYTPAEIIHSMGLVPMGAWGGDLPISEAKKYFPAFICSIMQSALELGMRGTYEGVSAIVIPSLCDSLKVLGENWKYAVPSIPFIPMTYPQNRKPEYGKTYTFAGYQRVISDLEKATGHTFEESRLAESIQIYNEHNEVMRTFAKAAANTSTLSATARSDVFKSAFFMLPEEHTVLVKELIVAMHTEVAEKKTTKVLLTGILADSPSLLQIFDEQSLQVVADDIAAQSRQYRTDTVLTDSPLMDLAAKFSEMDNCSVLFDPLKKRVDFLVEEAKLAGADGIIHVQTKFCDPEEFDYPLIKKACEKAGMPLIQIETDRQMENYEQARTMIQTFCEYI